MAEQPKQERQADWKKFVRISSDMQEVKEKGETKNVYRVSIDHYLLNIKDAIVEFGEAKVQARGKSTARAIDVATNKRLIGDGYFIEKVEINAEDREIDDKRKKGEKRTVRTSTIEITIKKKEN